MITLAKNNSDPPEEYSEGSELNPITARLTFDGSGTPSEIIVSTDNPVYVWVNDHTGHIDNYSNVAVELQGNDAGVVWELSLDNANWQTTPVGFGVIDVSASFQAVRLYARVRAINDGSLETRNYNVARFLLTGIGNPA